MATLYGYTRLLKQSYAQLKEEDLATAFNDMEKEALRLQRIIENMLVLARMDTSHLPVMAEIDVIEQLEHTIADFRADHAGRDVKLTVEAGGTVRAVPVYLEMITSNLLSNADKYSPADGSIEVRVRREGSSLIVSVLDEGIGLVAGEEENIFSAFFRSQRVQDAIGGVGLGLTVCRRLVEAQGGRIWAKARQGGGTEVAFALALAGRGADQRQGEALALSDSEAARQE